MKSKHTSSDQITGPDNLSPQLESLRQIENGYKVPDGYFDALNSRIIDRINAKDGKEFSGTGIFVLRKPAVWAPLLAMTIIIISFTLFIPPKKTTVITAYDELADITMAYDASYAEEVLLYESYIIEDEIGNIAEKIPDATTGLTDVDIEEYLNTQDLEIEMLTEY